MVGSEKPTSHLGPGYYDTYDTPLTQRKRGGPVPYCKDTSKRSGIDYTSPSKEVGPGSYEQSSQPAS
jgi:hypothetical protein